MKLSDILKDSNYSLSQFDSEKIEALEEKIKVKEVRGKETPFVYCIVRKKDIKLTPEEAIRQLYLMVLRDDYGYPVSRMELEYIVTFGREKKRADIVIFDKDQTTTPYIIVELKSPKLKDGKEQLKSYCNGTGAPIGVWTNGDSISYYHRKDPNFFEDISNIPRATERLSDILSERWTIDDLIKKDKLVNERKSLKDLILEMEDEVLANAGVDVFEEVFKLIFTKLYDEMESGRKPDRHLEFRNYGDTETELKDKLQALFDRAKEKWAGVFTDDSKLMLTPSHLSVCVSSLQDVKLFNSNLDVVDEAFEYLINKSSKGEKGQYFTPRYVIDMCVRMLNPTVNETMIDTAAGSCGFPVHTIFYVWQKILESKGLKKSHLFTLEKKPQECTDYVQNKVFAIDFDERAVRVARTLNLIAGDGQTNVLHLNTLDYERWEENLKDENWQDTYYAGWTKLKKMRAEKNSNRDFSFDILMANPPFAGDIKESRILAKYELSKNAAGKTANKVGRDILFIERNLDFLKPGGRMAIVLPQGRFNNSSDRYIRDYIAERCRILAVVGLHGNVFKPHTGTKTSVLFVQKWDDVLCPKKDDYPIFFATMQEPSKDNSGEKIYVKRPTAVAASSHKDVELTESLKASDLSAHYGTTPKENSEYLLDTHGHLIVKHDLFNHDGLTQDGIAEAFAEFAKRERLSFFLSSPFNEQRYKELLEGHGIKEVMLKEVVSSNEIRLEPEFYIAPPQTYAGLKGKDVELFSQYGTSKELNEDGVGYPVLRLNEFDSFFILKPAKYCDIIDGDTFESLRLHKDDVLICRTNGNPKYVGRAALVPKDYDYAFASYLFRIRPKRDIINSATLVTFLNSKYGRAEIEKYSMVGNQSNFSPAKFREISIPNFSLVINREIEEIVYKAFSLSEQSKDEYRNAEKILSDELDIKQFGIDTYASCIRQFKESFLKTGRLDAEYYSPRYASYFDFIKSHKNGYAILPDVCDIVEQTYFPMPNKKYKYIELGDIGDLGDITGYSEMIGAELPSRARRIIHTGDVIISSIEGSLQCIALVGENEDSILCSTGFFVLRPTTINSETLLVLFKSEPIQHLLKQQCSGTILTSIKQSDLQNIIVPNIDKSVQLTIAHNIQKSVMLRQQAKQLLEEAKLKVETAISGGGNNQVVTRYNKMIEQSTYYYRLAEWTLLEELYSSQWNATVSVNCSVKPFSVCQSTGRLDAEYYQPKYDALLEKLSSHRCDTLGTIVNIAKSIEPGSDAYCESGVPFVRVSDISKFGISETNIFLSEKDYDVEALRPKKDTILLSKDGSVGIAYKVTEDMNCITSGALLHLSVRNPDYLPDYLTLVLNSIVVRLQAERDSNGAVIQHWKPSEIEKVIIPHLPMETQLVIANKVKQSFTLRFESKRLLEQAKQLVEQAIERK